MNDRRGPGSVGTRYQASMRDAIVAPKSGAMVDLSFPRVISRSRIRPGIWLISVLGLAIFAAGVSAIAASTQLLKPRFTDAQRENVLSAEPAVPPAQRSTLPGFQRRGTSLVGEFRTQDGQTIRLVLDAKSHAVIGARIIKAAEPHTPSLR